VSWTSPPPHAGREEPRRPEGQQLVEEGGWQGHASHITLALALVAVGGGGGIAPMMSRLRTLADRNDRGDRRMPVLFHASRNRDTVIFRRDRRRAAETPPERSVRGARALHRRAEPDDGCGVDDTRQAQQTRRTDGHLPRQALQLRLKVAFEMQRRCATSLPTAWLSAPPLPWWRWRCCWR
jgi:hypothetical protein